MSQATIRCMPTGTQSPIIVRYNASSVPILQIAFTRDTLTDAEVVEYATRTACRATKSVRRWPSKT